MKAFTTTIYMKKLEASTSKLTKLNKQILFEAQDISTQDGAGKAWSKLNYRNGFTSYASANGLHKISPTFAGLERLIDRHVKKYAKELDMNLGGKKLELVTCWINIMQKGAQHAMHIHPLSVISGTYYVSTPEGSSPIKFEDPRLPLYMNAPPKREKSKWENRSFIEIPATSGNIVLFESWLRHEVPMQNIKEPRISVSFNYAWN
jgi:uncharacterized protein (TIGR02466 family)